MTHGRIKSVAIAAATALAATPLAAQSGTWDVLERVTADVMRATKTPGVQVVVVRGDSIVLARGFGVADVETGAPMTPDLLAQVGSFTKPFTAALVLTVAQRGTVSLRAPISRAVSGLRPKFRALTLSQLLSQTAGLGDREGSYGTSDESALLRAARELPDSVAFLPPGLSFSYSNVGFALAGLAAQEAAKQPFADLMRDRLLRPLGMTKATMRPREAATYPRAQGHKLTPKGDSVVVVRPIADDTRIWPAGYLYTNAREAARFAIALMNGGRVDGKQALAAGVTDSMLATHVALPGMPNATRYGYGMFLDTLRGHESAWHPGSMPGFSTLLRLIPERRVGVVIIANRDEVRMDRVAEAALEDALRPLGIPFVAPAAVAARLPAPAPGVRLVDYVGTYTNRFSFELQLKNGGLILRRFGAELPVVPLGNNTFAVQAPGSPTVDRFSVVPATGATPAFGQMFLWTFPRVAR
jgi:CubicO group peptidase (beta-lactamase class C family)